MKVLTISLLIGTIVFLMGQIVIDIFFKPSRKPLSTANYYADIRGDEKKKTNQHKQRKKTYKKIELNRKTYINYVIPAIGIIFLSSKLIFKNTGISVALSLAGFLYPKIKVEAKIKKRKEQLSIQFREAMQSIANSLKSGSSLQTAIERSVEDLERTLRSQVEKPMLEELQRITYDLKLGKTLEEALIDFKERAELEDVEIFVNAALITQEKGGNLTEVMASVSQAISDKLRIKREIVTLTAGKRSEAQLLTFMPIGLVGILSTFAPNYMQPMYNTAMGKIMIVVGVGLLLINYLIGKKIIDIDV